MKTIIFNLFIVLLSATISAHACPFCISETGQLVREGIFNADLLFYLFCTALPFLLFSLIAGLAIYSTRIIQYFKGNHE
ncbi:hypothetical protein [Legionella jordanis]|uniref:Transmembrane protein n=1 Tax=Legionella jordanis TaxID=456 RepID=A0A0W0VFW6_9GAMM|nr:hypothetical protein [Legionella jordanis]KTD19028.1 hypothetical protein Ljor_0251 [Legionella jordanis]RMX05413.1 hypothetical protein EAW55_01815 [Legionella jordanis]RMX19096.1 hypothetical protein EAS68_06565 [Legionella jordanis]VEH13131.1 Uncharacterised protein [Legionella jordanis]HAT8714790.1 hypothetical protein [Legionella jordanis]